MTNSTKYRGSNFRPVGETDSERAFCYLLERLRALWPDTGVLDFDLRWSLFQEICNELRVLGPANILYSDGEYLFVRGNQRTQDDGERRPPGLYSLCRECSHNSDEELTSEAISLQDLAPVGSGVQRVTLVASVPLTKERWTALAEGEMLAIQPGRIAARVGH